MASSLVRSPVELLNGIKLQPSVSDSKEEFITIFNVWVNDFLVHNPLFNRQFISLTPDSKSTAFKVTSTGVLYHPLLPSGDGGLSKREVVGGVVSEDAKTEEENRKRKKKDKNNTIRQILFTP